MGTVPIAHTGSVRWLAVLRASVVAIILALVPMAARGQAPSWLSSDSTARLNLSFPVLVPPEVPAPFSGEPDINASGGAYSLYWLIPGSPPTYLMITGEVGGSIPDFSYYDRNVQLQVNAQVRGYPAYHDLTPIYDKVYWEENGVVYTVDSQGLTATDSLSLANALIPLATTPVENGDEGGDGSNSPEEQPAPSDDTPVEAPSVSYLTCPQSVVPGDTGSIYLAGSGSVTVDASDGTFPAAEPNTSFAPSADGSDVLQGQLTGAEVTLSWLAPEAELTAYIFVRDSAGNVLAECGVQVVAQAEPETTPTPLPSNESSIGDGTGVDSHIDEIVERILTTKQTPVGDGTGGPDYDISVLDRAADVAQAARAEPTPTTRPPTPTPVPTPTLAPATDPSGMVALEIGPEGGELHCPSGATLVVPPGALEEPAVVAIRPVPDTKLPGSSRVQIVPGTGFDVTFAKATGELVERLLKPAKLTIELRNGAPEGVTLYRVSGVGFESLSGVSVSGQAATTSLTQTTRFVAGVPAASTTGDSERDPLPFIAAGLGFLILLSAVMLVGSAVLRARPRPVAPRRAAPSRVRLR